MLIKRQTKEAETPAITLEYLQQNHPDLITEIQAAGAEGVDIEDRDAVNRFMGTAMPEDDICMVSIEALPRVASSARRAPGDGAERA